MTGIRLAGLKSTGMTLANAQNRGIGWGGKHSWGVGGGGTTAAAQSTVRTDFMCMSHT